MLIGESINTKELCFIVTGDLAFFYDMNSLGIRHIKNNVRVLLINNGGGGEFKIMTRNWKQDVHVDAFISANGHNGSAKGWAENCGFQYLTASSKDDFNIVKNTFVNRSDKPILLEVFTLEDDEVLAMNEFIAANHIETAQKRVNKVLKNIIGETGIKVVKQILKK